MSNLFYMILTLLALILCTANVYAMHSYRISTRKLLCIFAVVTLICLAANTCIIIPFGREVFQSVMIFTVAAPYFVIFLVITTNKISQVFFNFWYWVNVYAVIANSVKLINDITFRSSTFEDLLVIALLFAHLLLYNKYFKSLHRRFLETPNVNWWVFSLVPLFFEVLIVAIHKTASPPEGFSSNYPVLLIVFLLMLLVYALIIYIFHQVESATKAKLAAAMYNQQMEVAKAQLSALNEAQIQTAVYRHDMRHNLTAIDAFLSIDQVQQARDYIKEIQDGIDSLTVQRFCEHELVNLLCASFSDKANRTGIRLSVNAACPKNLALSDMELCIILSNGFENALHAVSGLEASLKWIELYIEIKQDNLLIEIKNPFVGEIVMQDGLPITKRANHGYGCRSIQTIAKQNRGGCVFETEDGVFILRVYIAEALGDNA